MEDESVGDPFDNDIGDFLFFFLYDVACRTDGPVSRILHSRTIHTVRWFSVSGVYAET